MTEKPRVMIAKLNNDNYESWKYKVELLLIKEGLWDAVSKAAPAQPDAAWLTKDAQARATIGLLVEDNQLTHIRSKITAAATWKALQDYHQKSSLSSKVILLKNLCSMKLAENGNMEEHIINMSIIKDKLEAIGENIKEELFIAMILGSLPDSYNSLINALESRPEENLTLSLVKGKLIDEYRRRVSNSVEANEIQDKVLKTRDSGKYTKPRHDLAECFFCKKKGHMKKDCKKYKAWKEKNEKANTATADSNNKDNLCFNTSHEDDIRKSWYIDSGATSHMTNNREFFDITFTSVEDKVTVANGKEAKVMGIGSGKIKCHNENATKTITLKNVLYIPSLHSNLLSVKKITEHGFIIEFKNKTCNILKDKEIIVTAESVGNLYKLRTEHKALSSMKTHSDNCIHTWHRKLGHRDPDAIRKLVKENIAYGITLQECGIKEICENCIQGKMSRKPFPNMSSRQSKNILEIIHSDVCGPMQTTTPGGKRYVLTMIDDYSSYTQIFLLAHKSEVFKYVKEYIEAVKTKFNKKPKILRSDRGKEYVNKQMTDYLKEEGIKIELTAPFSPQQNGKAERKNRYLIEMARCMIIESNLAKKYWGEAIVTANHLQNRLPAKSEDKTPYEKWHSQKPNLKDTHIFGCTAYVKIPDEQRRKLDNKARKLHFVGYSEQSKAFRLLDKETNKIIISRDVVFLDGEQKPKEHSKEKENGTSEEEIQITQKLDQTTKKEEEENKEEEMDQLIKETGITETPQRKSKRKNKGIPPSRFNEFAGIVTIHEDDEPKTIEEALAGKDKNNWKKALDEEYESLIANKTWKLVEAPEDTKIIGSKWIFRLKKDEKGRIIRYKARLVALGYNQEFGMDYHEVFAPVVKQTTLRTLLTIAGRDKLQVRHYDIKNAFLNADLTEEIYMQQPKEYEVKGKEHYVLKLSKSIYGLKQSANLWNKNISNKLEKLGYTQGKTESCIYIKHNKDSICYVTIYVDDIIIASNSTEEMIKLEKALSSMYTLTKLGRIKEYSGIQVDTDKEGIYYIHQRKHIYNILKTYGLKDAKGSKTPLSVGYGSLEDNRPLQNIKKFQSLIGSLLYIATSTRPDIKASVVTLSKKLNNPTETDWIEAKRIARYLKYTENYRLKMGNDNQKDRKLIGYADANWAESKADRKSNSGYLFKYCGSTISWACRKQSCVALSSAEAEYVALSDACQEVLWLIKLLQDFQENVQLPVKMYEDNQSCIKLAHNQKFSKRSKHIDTKYHFIKDLNKDNKISLEYCPSENMIADMLTKALQQVRLRRLSKESGLIPYNEDDVIEEEC